MNCHKRWFAIALSLFAPMFLFAESLNFAEVDMNSAAKEITGNNKPLILYVSHTTCPYCKRLDQDIMPAVLNTEQYQNKIILQKLTWDSGLPVTWIDGQSLLPDQIVMHYKVRATPTLLFLDENANEIAKRIEGYQGPDFYWVYLDERIEQAQLALTKGD